MSTEELSQLLIQSLSHKLDLSAIVSDEALVYAFLDSSYDADIRLNGLNTAGHTLAETYFSRNQGSVAKAGLHRYIIRKRERNEPIDTLTFPPLVPFDTARDTTQYLILFRDYCTEMVGQFGIEQNPLYDGLVTQLYQGLEGHVTKLDLHIEQIASLSQKTECRENILALSTTMHEIEATLRTYRLLYAPVKTVLLPKIKASLSMN